MILPETYLIEKRLPQSKDVLTILAPEGKDNPDYDYYTKLAEWAGKHMQKTGEVQLDKLELSYKAEVLKLGLPPRTNQLWGMINKLIELVEKYSSSQKELKIIKQTTLEILAGLSKMPNPRKPEEPEEPAENGTDEAVSNKGKLDWTAERARRLNDAKKTNTATSEVLSKFYDDYYSQEYAGVESPEKDTKGIVAKLKSLDKVLTIEFNKLGYNSEVNPFAQFLKILIQKKPEIFEKLTLNNYGAIHNAFIEKHITGNMLGNYPDAIGTENILFCSDLYNRNGLDIVEYLSLQKQVLASVEGTEYANDPRFLSKMFIQQQVLDKNYLENVKALFNSKQEAVSALARDAKLKSLLEVRELYKHLFKTAAKKTADNNAIEKILQEAVKRSLVKDLLRYILGQDEFRRVHKKLAQQAKELLIKLKYHTDDTKLDRIQEEILADYDLTLDVEKKMASRVIAYLLDTPGKEKAGADK